MTDSTSDGSTVFQCLHEMDIAGERSSMNLDLVTTIHRLPALQTLSIGMLDFGPNHHFISNDAPDCLEPTISLRSSLIKINLNKACMDSNSLAFLLRACPHDQEISVLGAALNKAQRPPKINYEALGNTLRQFEHRPDQLEAGIPQA